MNDLLKFVVVGHTNVGKTSLLRTLLRDSKFGEVSDRPSTTRHVEGATLTVGGEQFATLFDTPGLEDASALLDYLEDLERIERQKHPNQRIDAPARLELFLGSIEARQRFEQEAKVIRQLLASDAGLYVIDAREPALAKYREELEVLSGCGKPLLPVVNFSATGGRLEEWENALARLNLHARAVFDTITPPIDGERHLYESLALLLDSKQRPALEQAVSALEKQNGKRRQSAALLVAELLVDCAAARHSVAPEAEEEAEAKLFVQVREREQKCVEALLDLYAFQADDARLHTLPLSEGRWGDDLFNPETLRALGIRVGSGMAAGALAGAGIDVMAGGLTLGTATAIGALVGGGAQTVRNYGSRLLNKLRGQNELTLSDSVLQVLAVRQGYLLQALAKRTHAATSRIPPPEEADVARSDITDPLQSFFKQARAYPEWSSLNEEHELEGESRDALVGKIASSLMAFSADATQ
ncbi:Conserved hypothetical protein [gamma proteobacterium HdN1]|nr:Conserved hypothetical protein [gamma proteobacterium HdN1]